MTKITAYIIILLLLSSATASAFESELLEGEGPSNFTAKKSPLTFYKEPSKTAPSFVTGIIKKGQEINYDQTRLITIKPGLVKANKSGQMEGRSLGDITYLSKELYYSDVPTRTVSYKKGDTFEYLHYRAEGECIIRKNKEVFEIDACPWIGAPEESDLKQASKPITEEWIRVIKTDGSPIGWLVIDKETIKSH